jgi:alpha-D-xyloside xylohydrolase
VDVTLEASSAEGRLVLSTTEGLRLERPDGSRALLGAVTGPLAYGTSAGGDTRYHDVMKDTPRGVRWKTLSRGLEQTSGSEGVLADDAGHSARVVLDAPAPGMFRLRMSAAAGEETIALSRLSLASDDGSYQGLGERFGHADARGSVVPMQLGLGGTRSGTNEHHVPIPFFVSSKGYGVFVASREAGAFDVASSDADSVHARFEGAELEIYFFLAPTPAAIVGQYSEATGLPRLPPRWASAPMYWRNAWESSDDLRTAAARLRSEDIPTTSFWIDNPWEASYNDHVFDPARFPDAPALLAEMQAMGYSPLLWSTPYVDAVDEGDAAANEAERLYLEARDRELLVTQSPSGAPFVGPSSPGAPGAMMDFTQPEAVTFWQDRIDPLVGMGVRAFKLDFAEDILVELLGARPGLRFGDGTTERETHNVYATLYHTPYRQALDAGPTGEGFLLVRAEAWGGQGVADIIWPGDLDSDMREGLDGEVGGLPAAITALVSLSASGFPSFASDTGGFRGDSPTRETLLRWAEHTAFSPFLQLGGGGPHHDPWLYDAEAGAIYHTLARAHMALVPYLRMYGIRAHETGLPPVLAPALAYPEDRGGYDDPYAYLLGDDLFVACVTTEGATTRALHLPPGAWVHWFTGERFEGPADISVPAPLGAPPVFVRVGAILPMLPDDLDTLIPTTDPSVIDPTQRPWLRARVIPGSANRVSTEEGIDIAAERVTDGVDLELGFSATGLRDLRLRLDLAHAEPAMTSVSGVNVDGTPLTAAADAATVEAGCDGACWAMDGADLVLSVRGVDGASVQVR